MSTYSEISAQELSEILTTRPTVMVDVRNPDEVARGVIAGAIHIPLAMLPLQFDSLKKADNIVFYCHSGVRSAHAASFAASKGLKNVQNLTGGVLAWARAGYPFVEYIQTQKNQGKQK